MGLNKLLIVICGPTASGKTRLAIDISLRYRTEILSADSRQFFKQIPVGTAQPSPRELQSVPHHFIASHDIRDEMSAGHFETEALELVTGLFRQYDKLVMVGGSGLYIDAVCKGLDTLPAVPQTIRSQWMDYYRRHGLEALQQQLKKADPDYYKQVDLNNYQRIVRALEVYTLSGKSFSSFRKRSAPERPFAIIKFAIDLDRPVLYKRINERADDMIKKGLIAEAQAMYPFRHLYPLQTVGYTELFDYFDGKTSLEEAIERIKQHTRHYAKRQLTWFRRDPSVIWLKPEELHLLPTYISG